MREFSDFVEGDIHVKIFLASKTLDQSLKYVVKFYRNNKIIHKFQMKVNNHVVAYMGKDALQKLDEKVTEELEKVNAKIPSNR